jgi:DNA-binding transcriptional ArsR family regulator
MATLAHTTELLGLLAEPTRVRLLALLAEHELAVAEVVTVTGLAQSRVSQHLAKLKEAGLLRDRRAGTSTFYALANGSMPKEARALWALVAGQVEDGVLSADAERARALVRARAEKRRWPESLAGELDRHYSPGRTWESLALSLVGLLELGDVLDVGCGDGAIAQLIAPHARSVTCVDASPRMVEAARRRLAHAKGATVVQGDACALPALGGRRFSHALMLQVLASVSEPARAVAEVAGRLAPGGLLALTTLAPHDALDLAAGYGHLHPGFAPRAVRAMLERAGLDVVSCDVTSRERRPPHFRVVTAFARKPSLRSKARARS